MSSDDREGGINIIPYYNIFPKFVLIDGRIPSGMRNMSSKIIVLPSCIPSGNILPVMSASPSSDDGVVMWRFEDLMSIFTASSQNIAEEIIADDKNRLQISHLRCVVG